MQALDCEATTESILFLHKVKEYRSQLVFIKYLADVLSQRGVVHIESYKVIDCPSLEVTEQLATFQTLTSEATTEFMTILYSIKEHVVLILCMQYLANVFTYC